MKANTSFNTEVKNTMPEISNIDAIIELILREAREGQQFKLATRAYMVLGKVANRLGEVVDIFETEEGGKLKDENSR